MADNNIMAGLEGFEPSDVREHVAAIIDREHLPTCDSPAVEMEGAIRKNRSPFRAGPPPRQNRGADPSNFFSCWWSPNGV